METTSNSPVFSIVIPCFRAAEKLAKTLDSVRDQDASSQIIVVDGSVDSETEAIVDAFRNTSHHRIELIAESDQGVYDAMNKGVAVAEGAYLYFIGAGDLLQPNVLSTVQARLTPSQVEMIYGDTIIAEKRYDGHFSRLKLLSRNICHQAVFYSREIFEIIGLYNLAYPQEADWEFNMRCFHDSRIVKRYVSCVIATYEGGGLSDQRPDYAFRAVLRKTALAYLGWPARSYYLLRDAKNAVLTGVGIRGRK